ncbi:MAG: type II toxin-antitoxin system RelE/ParE family toxin [Chloroflexota bacterium]|nr:type II toxin-antitoxin system RelE/ParE family toxin [Chloroflexota bacterium]
MPRRYIRRIRRELDKLAETPERRDIDVAKLRGRTGYRLRVGDYRIIFERDNKAGIIDVLRIASRGQAYRR